jgi:hypothetical protein
VALLKVQLMFLSVAHTLAAEGSSNIPCVSLEIPADSRLYRCPELQIGTQLPIPLSARLDALAKIGTDAWAPTTRKEVLGAVMLAFPPTIRALRKALNAYRTARVADAIVEGWLEEWRYFYPPGSAGPRTQYSLFEEVPQEPEPPPQCDPSELLSTAAAYRIGMVIPSPLAARIDLLVKLANTAGLRTTRQELVAAAILAATTDQSRLARQLHAYWHGTAGDAAIAGQPAEAIFKWPEGRPPRFRRAARTNRENRSEPPARAPGRRVSAPE